jgi:hypothetical protein
MTNSHITRLSLTSLIVAFLAGTSPVQGQSSSASAEQPDAPKEADGSRPTVVLVHGALPMLRAGTAWSSCCKPKGSKL